MRFVWSGLGVLVAVTAGLLVWGVMMDSRWQVEREVEIAEAPGPVFAYISILSNWPEWTAWNPKEYPKLQYAYGGPEWGVGATQTWQGGDMRGELRVTEFQPGEYLEYELHMVPGDIRLRGSLRIEATEAGSHLVWRCWGDSGDNPINKLMMRAYMPMIGRDFAEGLDTLKARFH